MSKKLSKVVLSIIIVVAVTAMAACGITTLPMINDADKAQYSDGNVPLTDLAATYKGEATDSDGNLLAPFDVVYPEAFESGEYAYDETAALLKFSKTYDGTLSKDLKSCGFKNLEKVSEGLNGSKWYRAEVSDGVSVTTAIQKARSLNAVLIADYDYLYENEATVSEGENEANISATETSQNGEANATEGEGTGANGIIDEVLQNLQVKDQWYLTACSIQRAWRFLQEKGISAGGSPSVTVAVIDTGVDYTHPDLKTNMWINTGEIPGNGIDDDGNGYVDDVYGCSTISDERFHSGDPMDDHGHGTHVAGIIAAANNKVGTVGVAYDTKIMAVKAGQATGVFLQSDIAEAITYAYTQGADVINMSFGGSACSIAVQEALQQAYTTSTLVAAAGNNGMPNEVADYYPIPQPSYPAALSYVTGVMSVNFLGVESSFTNWDVKAFNTLEYEVYAPGEAILSTLPNNRYGKLNGTSMAAPIVSGIAALLRSYYTDRDMYPSKFISAQLSATSGDTAICCKPKKHTVNGLPHNVPMMVNAYDALTKLPKPDVNLYNDCVFDTESLSAANNGDGVIDAGETLNLGVVLRNRWGMSKNTAVSIDAIGDLGVANPYVEILTGTVNFDGVGTYSTKDNLIKNDQGVITGVEAPLVVKISKDCPNDYLIDLNVTVTYQNGLDEADTNTYVNEGVISFAVRNGVVLPSQITEDMTLTKDNYYIVAGPTIVDKDVTLTIEAGAKVQFGSNDPIDFKAPYLRVEGTLVTQGSLDNMVELFPTELKSNMCVRVQEYEGGTVSLNYAKINNPYISGGSLSYCDLMQSEDYVYFVYNDANGEINYTLIDYSNTLYIESAYKCIFTNIRGSIRLQSYNYYDTCVFTDCAIDFYRTASWSAQYRNCVFLGNNYKYANGDVSVSTLKDLSSVFQFNIEKIEKLVSVNDKSYVILKDYSYDNEDITKFLKSIGATLYVDNGEIQEFWGYNGDKYELPSNSETIWTIEKLSDLYDEYIYQVGIDSFTQNAILNNLNDTNTSHWLIIRAAQSRSCWSPLSGVYFGTPDLDLVEKQIYDSSDDPTYGNITVYNYEVAPEKTFPFVVDAYLLNANGERSRVVSNETCTFVVEFNRDMDTTVPLRLRFGSSTPYAEYEIEGSYVTPRRWEGVYTLKTTIENGNQYFNISNARAADDHFLRLYETLGRFGFEIDTTKAMAMVMQGTATETGVELNWMQDDFDTFFGYNVYRSDREDGYYQRLNDYVLSAEENQFFDDTVEPGKLYYYNFTVVKTDMSESTPSGKVVVRAMDTMAPNVYHSPVRTAYTGKNLVVSATVTDNLQVTAVRLYYRVTGGEWKSTAMYNNNSRYYGIIGADNITLDGLEYYIDATDGVSHTLNGSAADPYLVTVKVSVDQNSMGDVDGDGVITNKDALMLLQAANDLLNLTEEQFMRADLNGDGELSAAEAMRILQYVSGKVSTVI